LNPAHLAAAGALAGGALLLFAALPTHALDRQHSHVHEPAQIACVLGAPCDPSKQAAPRRKPLKRAARRECARIDAAIRDNEQVEQRSGARGVMESLQQDVQSLRKRYRELGC